MKRAASETDVLHVLDRLEGHQPQSTYGPAETLVDTWLYSPDRGSGSAISA